MSVLNLCSCSYSCREQLTGSYGIAALRGNLLYRPFEVPRCSPRGAPAGECHQWVQHVPGEEAGGSGGGGVCTDTVHPADLVDSAWRVQVSERRACGAAVFDVNLRVG